MEKLNMWECEMSSKVVPLLITESVHAAAPPRRLTDAHSGPIWLRQQPAVPCHGTAAAGWIRSFPYYTRRIHSPCFLTPEASVLSEKLGSDASSAPSVGIHGAGGPTHHVDCPNDRRCHRTEEQCHCRPNQEDECVVSVCVRCIRSSNLTLSHSQPPEGRLLSTSSEKYLVWPSRARSPRCRVQYLVWPSRARSPRCRVQYLVWPSRARSPRCRVQYLVWPSRARSPRCRVQLSTTCVGKCQLSTATSHYDT